MNCFSNHTCHAGIRSFISVFNKPNQRKHNMLNKLKNKEGYYECDNYTFH